MYDTPTSPSWTVHWHAGHNVSGYLPESDDLTVFDTFADAKAALLADLKWAADDAIDIDDGQRLSALEDAKRRLTDAADTDTEFLACTRTHGDSDYDIPTAWWIQPCDAGECII